MATNTNPFYTYSATAGSSKTLQKPQDGGDNNQWGNYINTDLDEIVSAVNALSDKIADASENTLLDFTATGSAVNHVGITNAALGNGPTISTAGTDSNVDLNVTPKGTGDSVFTNKIKVDDVVEKTTDHGVEIDGVTLKDGGGTFSGNVSFGDNNITNVGDISLDTISSDAGTSIGVTLGTDAGDNFNVGSNKLVVEGDTGNVGIGTSSPDGSSFSASSSPVLDVSGTRPLLILSETDDNTKKAWVGLSADHFYLGGTNTSIRFFNDTTERLRIDSSGNVELKTTNADLILPSGGGIDFGTSTSGSGTVTGGVLDDYEEGTFDPSVNATISSYASRSGHYVKIGQLVTVTGYIQMTKGSDSSTSTLRFNVPFTVINTGAGSGFGEGGGSTNIHRASNFSANTPDGITFVDGQAYGELRSGTTATRRTDVGTNSLFYFSLQYFTTT